MPNEGGNYKKGDPVMSLDGRKGKIIDLQGGLATVKYEDGTTRIEPIRHLERVEGLKTTEAHQYRAFLPESVPTQSASLQLSFEQPPQQLSAEAKKERAKTQDKVNTEKFDSEDFDIEDGDLPSSDELDEPTSDEVPSDEEEEEPEESTTLLSTDRMDEIVREVAAEVDADEEEVGATVFEKVSQILSDDLEPVVMLYLRGLSEEDLRFFVKKFCLPESESTTEPESPEAEVEGE